MHTLYVLVFLASTYDCLARSTHNHSPNQMRWIIEAKLQYAKAIETALSLQRAIQSVDISKSDELDEMTWLKDDIDAQVHGLVAQIHTHLAHLEKFRDKVEMAVRQRAEADARRDMSPDRVVGKPGSSGEVTHERVRQLEQSARFCPQRYIDLAEAALDELSS